MRYAVGQVWKYHHRHGEDGSRLTVLRIDTEPGYGNIVHVAVSGLSIRATQAPDGYIREMSHLPFAEDAIDQSVTELVDTLPARRLETGTWSGVRRSTKARRGCSQFR